MKISKLTKGLLVSFLLSATVAEADSKYPATDFKPIIVYQDSDYKHTGSTTSSSSSKAKFVAEVSVADPDFPAANFEPEVLFQDKGYKHTKDKVSPSSATASTSVSRLAVEETETAQAESEESSLSLILGLAVLAVAGFVFYSKSAKKTVPVRKTAVRPVEVTTSGEAISGVDKYLEGKAGAKPSGVSKYLEERNTAVSSVSKYVAKQKVSARLASVTGVEKYLKDRG